MNESKTGNQISDILNENEKQSARQETQGRIPIVGRRKWFEKNLKQRKEVLLFFVLFVYTPANVFNRFQQFFHWLGKTAIIAIDMTKWNQNFFGGCVAVSFLSSHARKKKLVSYNKTHPQKTHTNNLNYQ